MHHCVMDRTGIGTFYLRLCVVVYIALGQDVNVARNKTYRISSRYAVAQWEVSDAANGNRSGSYPGNCIHTDLNDIVPWFEVDLGRIYPLKNFTVWPRTGHPSRLYPFNITVDGQLCVSVTNRNERNPKCSSLMYGQTVRLTKYRNVQNQDPFLNLCELEIWVPNEVSQCEAGKYGATCTLTCSAHCRGRPDKNFCYQSSGYCFARCVGGWYGDQCSEACSPGCKNTSCDQETGDCECKQGHYTRVGSVIKCQSICPAVCRKCNHTTGECEECEQSNRQLPGCSSCVGGRYGDTCTKVCPVPLCRKCHRTTGECEECARHSYKKPPFCTDCIGGRYGDSCTSICPAPNCQQCHQTTGICEQCTQESQLRLPDCTECQDEYYHSNGRCVQCSRDCETQNSTQSCDKQSGKCVNCVENRYGDMCTSICPVIDCLRCNQITGECEECAPNSHGQPSNCTGNSLVTQSNTAVIAGTSLAVILIICLIILIVIFIMKRQAHRAKSPDLESKKPKKAKMAEQPIEIQPSAASPLSSPQANVITSGEQDADRAALSATQPDKILASESPVQSDQTATVPESPSQAAAASPLVSMPSEQPASASRTSSSSHIAEVSLSSTTSSLIAAVFLPSNYTAVESVSSSEPDHSAEASGLSWAQNQTPTMSDASSSSSQETESLFLLVSGSEK